MVEHHFHDAPGYVADVRLVIGVALDDGLAVSSTENAHRQTAGSMHDLAGHVDGEVTHHDPAGRFALPGFGLFEIEVKCNFLTRLNDAFQIAHVPVLRLLWANPIIKTNLSKRL